MGYAYWVEESPVPAHGGPLHLEWYMDQEHRDSHRTPLPAGCPPEAGSGTNQLQLQCDVDE